MAPEPTTLQEAVLYFQDADNCLNYLLVRRWPNGVVVCPTCGSTEVRFLATRRLWECKTKHFRQQFSIKIGTIMEDSPLGLDKWLPAMWMIGNDRNGISSYEIHRALKVTQKTAWFMLHRIRLGMQNQIASGELGGEVEVDETFIGGKSRNRHKDKRLRKITGTGGKDKAMVLGILERREGLRRKLIDSAGGGFPGFPLRLWAALARIERGLFFVLRFAFLNYSAWHRYDLTHESVESVELGGLLHVTSWYHLRIDDTYELFLSFLSFLCVSSLLPGRFQVLS